MLVVAFFSFFAFLGNAQQVPFTDDQHLESSPESTSNYFVRRGWRIAGADAAGALGGAGSVAGIASWFSWTPAAPVAGFALGIGAIIGGAGASLAASNSQSIDDQRNPKNPNECDYPTIRNEHNYLDSVGELHNRLLWDYRSQHPEYNASEFYDFVEQNKENYGIDSLHISREYLISQEGTFSGFHDIDEINQYTLSHLPVGIDHNIYADFLNELSDISDKTQAIEFIKNFENSELLNETYNEQTKCILGSFLSTYKHSIEMWY